MMIQIEKYKYCWTFSKFLIIKLERMNYLISSNKNIRRLFSFEALRSRAYWRVVLKRGRHLFQCKINYSHKFLFFQNNNKWPPLVCIVFDIPELLVTLISS